MELRPGYKVEFSRFRSILIKVLPHGEVLIRAPKRTQISFLEAVLERRSKWVEKRRAYYKNCYLLNHTGRDLREIKHYYLGSELGINVYKDTVDFITVTDGCLNIHTKNPADTIKIELQLRKWYQKKALSFFSKRISLFSNLLAGRHKKEIFLRSRYMKSSWGSCSGKGKITLNTQLIKTPMKCIDYVILHELCHLVYMNHGSKYYALLSELMPDWKERLAILRQYALS